VDCMVSERLGWLLSRLIAFPRATLAPYEQITEKALTLGRASYMKRRSSGIFRQMTSALAEDNKGKCVSA
jgi:hypothetical protein